MNEATAQSLGAVGRIQRRVYEVLDGAVMDRTSKIVEIFIASLVVANVVAIILESVESIHDQYEHFFHVFDTFSVVVFSVEYVLRVWSYGRKYLGTEPGLAWKGRKEYLFLSLIHISEPTRPY